MNLEVRRGAMLIQFLTQLNKQRNKQHNNNSSPKMKSAFNLLLVTLFVFDTIFLACNIGESLSAIGVDHGERASES